MEVTHQCRPHRKGQVGPPLVDYDWHAFCQAVSKGIEGEDWRALRCLQRNEQGCVEKLQEAQKAKALWKMKAAKDAGEEYYDPTREDNILRKNKTRLVLWEEHLKDPIVALDKALKCPARAGVGFLQRLWDKPIWEGVSGPAWIRWIVCVYAQRLWRRMCQGSMGRTASSFSS